MRWRQISLATMLIVASGAAWGQIDCNRLNEDMRPRCVEVNRMIAACAGLEGEKRRTCEQQNLPVVTREDCSRAPAPAQAICEEHNRAVEAVLRCRNKTGAALAACARENVKKSGARQL